MHVCMCNAGILSYVYDTITNNKENTQHRLQTWGCFGRCRTKMFNNILAGNLANIKVNACNRVPIKLTQYNFKIIYKGIGNLKPY